jgi:hypothetical protein
MMSASEIFLTGVVYIAYIAVPLVIIPRHVRYYHQLFVLT